MDVDEERLERLFAAYASAVRAYARRRTDPSAADDVVMEVFLIACRRVDDLPSDPLPWLLGCARRVLANQRRSARRADALVLRLGSERPAGVDEPDAVERLNDALATLREPDREILLLNAWEGLEGAALATVLGCSRAAASVRLHRARRRLSTAYAAGASARRDDPDLEAVR